MPQQLPQENDGQEGELLLLINVVNYFNCKCGQKVGNLSVLKKVGHSQMESREAKSRATERVQQKRKLEMENGPVR